MNIQNQGYFKTPIMENKSSKNLNDSCLGSLFIPSVLKNKIFSYLDKSDFSKLALIDKSFCKMTEYEWNVFFDSRNSFPWQITQPGKKVNHKLNDLNSKKLLELIVTTKSIKSLTVRRDFNRLSAADNLILGLQACEEYKSPYVNDARKEELLSSIKTYFTIAINQGASATSLFAFRMLFDTVPYEWYIDLIIKCVEKGNLEILDVINDCIKSNETSQMVKDLAAKLKNNILLIKAAVKHNGMYLSYASDDLKNNAEIVKLAVRQNGFALRHASNKLKNDAEIIELAVQQNISLLETNWMKKWVFSTDNIKLAKLILQKDGMELCRASKELKNNIEVVTCAIQQNPEAIKYASLEMQNHPQIKNIKL